MVLILPKPLLPVGEEEEEAEEVEEEDQQLPLVLLLLLNINPSDLQILLPSIPLLRHHLPLLPLLPLLAQRGTKWRSKMILSWTKTTSEEREFVSSFFL